MNQKKKILEKERKRIGDWASIIQSKIKDFNRKCNVSLPEPQYSERKKECDRYEKDINDMVKNYRDEENKYLEHVKEYQTKMKEYESVKIKFDQLYSKYSSKKAKITQLNVDINDIKRKIGNDIDTITGDPEGFDSPESPTPSTYVDGDKYNETFIRKYVQDSIKQVEAQRGRSMTNDEKKEFEKGLRLRIQKRLKKKKK